MAKAKRRSPKRKARSSARGRSPRARNGGGTDAITLLKADHREVERLFSEFRKTRSDERRHELAAMVCRALKQHARIEHEIFYPAFLEATQEKSIHHEAEVEHAGVEKLIAEIEASGPDDDYFEAKVNVLSEMVRHHVNEEEKRGGMFAKAKQAGLDLQALGERLAARKAELTAESGDGVVAQGGRKRASRGSGMRAYAEPVRH